LEPDIAALDPIFASDLVVMPGGPIGAQSRAAVPAKPLPPELYDRSYGRPSIGHSSRLGNYFCLFLEEAIES